MPTPSCLWPQRAEEAHFEVGFENLHEAQQAEFGPLFRSMSAKTHHAWDTSTTDGADTASRRRSGRLR